MNIYIKNRKYRALANSSFLNAIGSALFNLVFLVYAQTLPFKTLALSIVSLANLLPTFFMILNGYWADNTEPKHRFRYVTFLRCVQGLMYFGLAVIIQRPGTFFVFASLVIINIVADFIADYTSDLIMHYEKRILSGKNDYQDAMGFSAGMRNIISMVFQAVGASLIVLLHNNFALFGVINGVSFLLAGIVLLHDRKVFLEIDHDDAQERLVRKVKKEGVFTGIVRAVQIVYSDKPLFAMLILAVAVNSLGTAIDGLTSVLVANVHALWFGNFATTIAIINIAGSLAITVSALFMHDGLQRISLPALSAITTVALVVFATNMVWWRNPVLMVFSMIIASYPIGKINPRMQSDVFSKADSEHLSATISVISTATLIGAPLGNVVFLGIANVSTPAMAWLVFGIVSGFITVGAIICAIKWPDNTENRS